MIEYWDDLKWWKTEQGLLVNRLEELGEAPPDLYEFMELTQFNKVKRVYLGINPTNNRECINTLYDYTPVKDNHLILYTPLTNDIGGWDCHQLFREFFREVLGELSTKEKMMFVCFGNLGKRYRRFLTPEANYIDCPSPHPQTKDLFVKFQLHAKLRELEGLGVIE